MRIFQNIGSYPAYQPRLAQLIAGCNGFAEALAAFAADRFCAVHYLKPVIDGDPQAFFTNAGSAPLQELWAHEHGLPAKTELTDILLAQIEEHRTEVFYNLDPIPFGKDLVRRLPGCVKHTIAWRAAPSPPGTDFGLYSMVVCNFASILRDYEQRGWRAGYLAPAHDPAMDRFGVNEDRPVDVVFVGGYSRHHRRRAEFLETAAQLASRYSVRFHLDRSRLTRLAESPVGRLLPLAGHRRPSHIRAVSAEPVFGLDLYEAFSRAKIVLNGAIDMAGSDRGNMRCFEALGCGALMVSDAGTYPQGMVDQGTFMAYRDNGHAIETIERALRDDVERDRVRRAGFAMVRETYSKEAQWLAFKGLVASL